jgi:hypothetical protein
VVNGSLTGKVALVTGASREITDIDGRVNPSLRADRGVPVWGPIAEAAHGR